METITVTQEARKRHGNRKYPINSYLNLSLCILNRLYLLNEIFYFALQSPPLEFDGHQLIGTHLRTVRVVRQLLLEDEN